MRGRAKNGPEPFCVHLSTWFCLLLLSPSSAGPASGSCSTLYSSCNVNALIFRFPANRTVLHRPDQRARLPDTISRGCAVSPFTRSRRSAIMSEDQLQSPIDGILPFLQSIEWRDPWLALLLTFHIAITMTALMTRNHANFQIMLFFALLLLVYFSESINQVAASKWMLFSRQQYFDSNGLFVSVVFSVPILMNCMIMIASWLYQSSQLMTNLKKAQLKQQARNRQIESEGERENATENGLSARKKQE